jgi:hypothetical protein
MEKATTINDFLSRTGRMDHSLLERPHLFLTDMVGFLARIKLQLTTARKLESYQQALHNKFSI